MKKITLILTASVLAVSAFAMGLTAINAGIFNATGTTTATAVILPQAGKIALLNLSASSTGTVTAITKFYAQYQSAVSAAITSAAPVSITCKADGTVAGYTPTSSDYMIVVPTSGTPTLYSIAGVGGITTNALGTAWTLSITNGTTASFAAGQAVYIIPSGKIVTEAYSTTAINNVLYQGIGNPAMPVAVKATGTGATFVSGYFEVWK